MKMFQILLVRYILECILGPVHHIHYNRPNWLMKIGVGAWRDLITSNNTSRYCCSRMYMYISIYMLMKDVRSSCLVLHCIVPVNCDRECSIFRVSVNLGTICYIIY